MKIRPQAQPLRPLLAALGLAFGAATASAGGIALFEGTPGGVGNLRAYDELSGLAIAAPPELQGIRLLPIDFAGRTRLEELLPGRPRLRSDVAGASRLSLAGQRGSLYHYSRDLPAGGARFGYFRIAADGGVIVLFELSGSGPLGLTDPFLARVAVAPASDRLLAATTLGAGGNLYQIDLAGGAVLDRTAALAPQRFSVSGLSLGSTLGVAVSTAGILRFDPSQSGDAAFVGFAPAVAPAWFSGQLVASRNGQWFLTSAGASSTSQLPFAFGATGSAVAVSQQPAQLSIAGFQPEVDDGPYMAIRDDGQQAAWRIDAGATREILLGHVQPAPGEQPELISGPNFLDTLDEIGLAFFRPTGELHVAVGKSPAGLGNALESFDTYAVTLPATPGPASFVNLSLFSGDPLPPFDLVPQMKADDWVLLPDQSTLLVCDTLPADGVLYAVRPDSPGAQPLLGFIKRLDGLEPAGRWLVANLRRSDGNRPQELWRLPLSLAQPAALLLSLPDGTQYTRFAARRDGWLAFVSHEPAGTQILRRAQLPTGTLQDWNPATLDLGAALGFTQFGSIAWSVDLPVSAGTWPLGALPPVQLQSTSGPCQILPGL